MRWHCVDDGRDHVAGDVVDGAGDVELPGQPGPDRVELDAQGLGYLLVALVPPRRRLERDVQAVRVACLGEGALQALEAVLERPLADLAEAGFAGPR